MKLVRIEKCIKGKPKNQTLIAVSKTSIHFPVKLKTKEDGTAYTVVEVFKDEDDKDIFGFSFSDDIVNGYLFGKCNSLMRGTRKNFRDIPIGFYPFKKVEIDGKKIFIINTKESQGEYNNNG